jgi:hypothetical protein
MRAGIFATLVVLSCQPIMIGNPGEAGGTAALDGASGTAVGGGAGTVGIVPNLGGMAGGGAPSTGGSGGSGNTGGSALGGAPSAGAATGGAATGGAAGMADAGAAGANAGGSDDEPDAIDEPPRIINERVQVVIYDPTMVGSGAELTRLSTVLGVESPDALAMRLMDDLETWTRGHVHHEILPFKTSMAFPPTLDGFRYTQGSYEACLANAADCHAAAADYDAIQIEQDLCNSVQTGNTDQIWLLGAEHFGFAGGKQLSCQVTEDGKSFAKTLDVVQLDYHDGYASILASYQIFALGALQQVFGVPPADATAEAADNAYGLFVQSRGRARNAGASGCGDITFAPNSLQPNRFDDALSLLSYCDTFLHSPRAAAPLEVAQDLDCTAWGCTEQGFRGYWFAHVPQGPWSDAQGRLNDFWRYLLSASERLPPPPISVTCSSSYEPGWCAHAVDHKPIKCNFDEWATAEQATGYVEFRFEPKRLVSGVQLFDRACDEQVLAGHLEFSDGSASIRFGALETRGDTSTSETFEPKLLSGLRVVIDESTGANPGFAEITVASMLPP